MSQTNSNANNKALTSMLHIHMTASSNERKKGEEIASKKPGFDNSTPVMFRSLQAKLFFEGK
jgi:hypothetical protein